MFQGSMVALVTPMHTDGSIDKKSLHRLIDWHLEAGTSAFIIAGSTGEAATLSDEEQIDLLTTVIKQVKQRIPVIAGTGTNCTARTIQSTLNAKKAGADACLVVTPYYNKPTQNGLFQHYKMVAEKTQIPLILYNVPGRTGCDLLPETVERLAAVPNIIGIKEATGKLERVTDLLNRCGSSFALYSGDDETSMEFILLGGKGVISVTANAAPQLMHDMCQAALTRDRSKAEQINHLLLPLHRNLFLESNPIPIKWVLSEMGFIEPGIRLPLLPLDSKYHTALREAMQAAQLLEVEKK